jgi:hypothetical protein
MAPAVKDHAMYRQSPTNHVTPEKSGSVSANLYSHWGDVVGWRMGGTMRGSEVPKD